MSPLPNPSGELANPQNDVAQVFHALGDPTRRAILERLGDGPLSVSRLAEPLGITLTAVVQHLQILEECGLIRTEKTGRVRTCRIDTSGFSALEQWMQARRTTWDRRLDRLGKLLATPDEDDQDSLPVGIS